MVSVLFSQEPRLEQPEANVSQFYYFITIVIHVAPAGRVPVMCQALC